MVKKRSLLILIMGVIFGCLLSCGIFAVVTKSVSFNLALKLDPQIFFSLSMKIDKNGSGSYSQSYLIFDNKTGANVVNWATVNQNCIVLNQVLAGDILSNLTINSRFEITVTNLTESNEVEYLNLTLNYNGEEEVFKADNGYGAVNMKYGEYNGEYAATKSFEIIPQTTLLDGYIQVPFKAEIDTELRYTATITTENCELVSAPRIFKLNENYTAVFNVKQNFEPDYKYTIKINDKNYNSETTSNTLEIPFYDVTGNLIINVYVEPFNMENIQNEPWDGTIATCFGGGNGSANSPYKIYNAKQLALMTHLINNANSVNAYSGTVSGKSIEITCDSSVYFGTAHYELKNDIILNENYENYESWNENTTGLNTWTRADTFHGTLNGNMHSIKGLYIATPDTTACLILNCKENTVITNLILEKGFVFGKEAAAFCGAIQSEASIIRCYNSCNIKSEAIAQYQSTGGITTQNYGTIDQCFNAGNVEQLGNYQGIHTAGIAGSNHLDGVIKNSYNIGNITSTTYTNNEAGGICGNNGAKSPASAGYVENCYNTGSIIGGMRNGEIAAGCDRGYITNCYAITSKILGYNGNSNMVFITNCGTLASATYTGWDFENVWGWIDGYDYPVLRCFNPDARATK